MPSSGTVDGVLYAQQANFDWAMRKVAASPYVAIDTETTGLRPWEGTQLRGVSFATADDSWYMPMTHPGAPLWSQWEPSELAMLVGACRRIIMHHSVFDVSMLIAGLGLDVRDQVCWDSQVGEWLIDENQKIGLKPSAERRLEFDAGAEQRHLKQITKHTGRTWETFTAEDIGAYAAMDARLTWDLAYKQEELLGYTWADPDTPMQRELELQWVLVDMDRVGVRIDREHLAQCELDAEARLAEIEAMIPVNPNSAKQVREWLYHDLGYPVLVRTPSGEASTSKNALIELAERESPEADLLLEHRHLKKASSAYYRPLRERGERIHPHFSSTRTVTGRLSCSDPNLMTIPRGDVMGEVRAAFIPADGYELWEFDLKQAELRVIAGYCDEPAMIDALLEGRDLHSETAASIFGPDFTPLQRRFAKNLNFGFPYGIGPKKFATYINPVPTSRDVEEAAAILRGYRETYPNIVKTMKRLESFADNYGKIPMGWPGRYRHFRGAGYVPQPGYTALNAIVQGGIGEFMKDVMIHPMIRPGLQSAQHWRLILQIHDALVFEVRPGFADLLMHTLSGIAAELNPFKLPMEWDRKEWK